MNREQILKNPFYSRLEEGVREWVFLLRNAGINTEDSCHHEGYIQCQSTDPTEELITINSIMFEAGVERKDFSVAMHSDWARQIVTIWAEVFKVSNETKFR